MKTSRRMFRAICRLRHCESKVKESFIDLPEEEGLRSCLEAARTSIHKTLRVQLWMRLLSGSLSR